MNDGNTRVTRRVHYSYVERQPSLVVQIAVFKPSRRAAQAAAVLAALGFLGIALFQVALVGGAPWGHAAWGGAEARLPTAQRIGSAFAALVWTGAALATLGHTAFVAGSARLASLFRWGTWIAAAVSAAGALPNFASQSRYENLIFGPLALLLAVLCVVVARGADHSDT